MSTPPPDGVYVPAVVFLDANEEFDEDAMRAHILRLAQAGLTGILVQGSNGEAQHLSRPERNRAIALTRSTLDAHGFAHVLVIAGTGAQSTKETIELCRDAEEAGAEYALVLTPSTWPPQMTREAIVRFHTAVADASPIPTMIYNFPTVTAGIDLTSDVLITLGAHPNIVGAKFSCGNIGKLQRVVSALPRSSFAAFPGKADVFLQGLVSGSAGLIGALPNVAPKAHIRLLRLYKEGNKMEGAVRLQALLGQADWELSKLGSIAGIKAVVSKHFGYGSGVVRGPLVPVEVSSAASEKLEELIRLEKSL